VAVPFRAATFLYRWPKKANSSQRPGPAAVISGLYSLNGGLCEPNSFWRYLATCALANSNDLGARALLALSSGDANGVFYLKHLTRMVPGATDAALSPDIASLNNPGPGLPNYTTPVFHQ